MMNLEKETAMKKIAEMPVESVSKVLIFMAGMEAERIIDKKGGVESGLLLASQDSGEIDMDKAVKAG